MHNSGLAFNMILQKIRYTPLIAQAAAQLIAIHSVFAFTMSDHRFNG